jgi:hypothetical protein
MPMQTRSNLNALPLLLLLGVTDAAAQRQRDGSDACQFRTVHEDTASV